MPKYVWEALNMGYRIKHKGLLVSCSQPSMVQVAAFRCLFVAMEAAFSFHFWAMKSKVKDYGMAKCTPWARDSFSYEGLCSHNSLLECVKGDFDLTAKQVEELELLAKEKKKLNNAKQYQRMREVDLEGYRARKRRYGATYRINSADKKAANEARYLAKKKEAKTLHCETCGVVCTSQRDLQRHLESRRHKLQVKRKQSGALRFSCRLCDKQFTHQCHLDRHKEGQKHQERVRAANLKSSSTTFTPSVLKPATQQAKVTKSQGSKAPTATLMTYFSKA
jgi:hypothetical protein